MPSSSRLPRQPAEPGPERGFGTMLHGGLPKLPARLCNILGAGLGFEASGLLSGLGRRAWASLLCFCFGSNGCHSGWRLALSSWPCALSALQSFLFALLDAFSCSFGVGPFFELWKMMCFNYPWFEPGSGGYCRVNLPIHVIQAVSCFFHLWLGPIWLWDLSQLLAGL